MYDILKEAFKNLIKTLKNHTKNKNIKVQTFRMNDEFFISVSIFLKIIDTWSTTVQLTKSVQHFLVLRMRDLVHRFQTFWINPPWKFLYCNLYNSILNLVSYQITAYDQFQRNELQVYKHDETFFISFPLFV